MTTLLNVNRVTYQCSCGTWKPLCYLYFCRHCLKVKCKDCVIFEVDCRFCPNCYEHIQSHEAVARKNRCQTCFACPACNHTLVTRATNASSAVSSASSNPLSDSNAADADENISSSTNVSGLQTPSKKFYYLACSVCRWSTRDIRLVDQPTLNAWRAQENAHEPRFTELLQYYKQIATREKQERDRKRYATVKLRNPVLTPTIRSSSDKYGLLAPLTRRGIGTGVLQKNPSIPDTTPQPPKPAETLTEIEPLDENFYLSPSFDFNRLTTIEQRLNSVESQPLTIDRFYPLAKHFTSKQSKRCKECDHNVLKPEPSPRTTKFKLHQMAFFFVPEIRIWHHPIWILNESHSCILSIINHFDERKTLKILSLDEVRKENSNDELINRIEKLENEVLTGELTFPVMEDRTIQLHPHVELNETDTKIDDELRQKDNKELIIHRKFAKLAIRCCVKLKQKKVKNILVAFVIEHRVVGISSIVSTPTGHSTNLATAQNVQHLVLVDFGSIDEPALPLHSSLK